MGTAPISILENFVVVSPYKVKVSHWPKLTTLS
jgi:hypothetical protein